MMNKCTICNKIIVNQNQLYCTDKCKDQEKIDYFNDAFVLISNDEGGYANNSDDHGGETYAGISRKFNPSWDGWITIDAMKNIYGVKDDLFEKSLTTAGIKSKVMDFYKKSYWDLLHCADIESKEISLKLFDMAVNLGIPRAVNILQTALNSMSHPLGYEIAIDGIIGSITVKLINEVCIKEWELLLNLITIQQGNLYIMLAKNNKNQREFLRGWINRLDMKVELFK